MKMILLFGLTWNKCNDIFKLREMTLDESASTRRSILSSVQSNFDPLGFLLPVGNRSRLFLHRLQVDADLSWDSPLSKERLYEWKLIADQINKNFVQFELPRLIGDRSVLRIVELR